MRLTFHEPRFLTSATAPEHYPKTTLPEVAIVGRSNVGKSSLINDLLRFRGLARISRTPGKTRLINFFTVDDQFLFVDLPGYGFAKHQDESWGDMIETYLKTRSQLRLLLFLLDSRHEPSEQDRQMIEWLKQMHFRIIVVLTKVDKVPRGARDAQTALILKAFGDEIPPYVHYSATHREGRPQLIASIGKSL